MVDELRELVKRCLAGEQAAMVELVHRYSGQVFGLCYRMLGQRQDAEDASQATFLRVLKNLARWDPARDFEPWLLAIAGNRCRTALAQRMRRQAPQSLIEDIQDPGENGQEAQLLAEEVQMGLARLRLEYRQAFVLFHEHEMGYAEIAETMQVPLGTIKTWVHRARRELIMHLKQRHVVEEAPDVV